MFKKKNIILLIIIIGPNMGIQSQGSVYELWSNPLGDLWLDLLIDEQDRDLDSNIDTIHIHHTVLKANEDLNKEILYSWSLEVFSSNSSDFQQSDPKISWLSIKNNTENVTISADDSARGFSDFVTVESSSSVLLFIYFNINQAQGGQFSWRTDNLSIFNETLRELNIEDNGGVTPTEHQFIPPTPWSRENTQEMSILDIPNSVWWGTGIIMLIIIGLYTLKRIRSSKNTN